MPRKDDSPHKAWSRCKRKHRFTDEHRATRRARELGLRAYGCSNCHGWHLTKAPLLIRPIHVVPVAPKSPIKLAKMRLDEAHSIFGKLMSMKRRGVELPQATIDHAHAKIEEAEQNLAALREEERTPKSELPPFHPYNVRRLEAAVTAAQRKLDAAVARHESDDVVRRAQQQLQDAQDALHVALYPSR